MTRTIAENKTLVRRIYEEMWNQANPIIAREIFAKPEGVEKFLKDFLAAFPDIQHKIIEMIAEGDRVVALFSAQGTHKGRWKEYPASDKAIHYTGVTLAQVQEGKIIRHHTWWDTWELIDQITK